jgi:antitoxin ParD1/3/4
MDSTTRLSVELPEEVAESVRAKVASGTYGSISEVVAEGLALLAEQDEPLDPSVETGLAAGYDAWKADPGDVLDIDAAAERLKEESSRRQHRG